jgi:hypothetical protein
MDFPTNRIGIPIPCLNKRIIEAVLTGKKIHSCYLVSHDMGNSVALELIKRQNEGRSNCQNSKYVMLNGSVLSACVGTTAVTEAGYW